ncbi:hypothetical protein Zmor_011910, partial [Zophobas morio]
TAATPVYIEASELDSNNESQLSYDYFACGGSVTQSVSVCETFKEDPQYYFKRGYSAGWYKDEHCTEVDDSISTPQINAKCITFGKYSFSQESNDPSKVTLVEGTGCTPTPTTFSLNNDCTPVKTNLYGKLSTTGSADVKRGLNTKPNRVEACYFSDSTCTDIIICHGLPVNTCSSELAGYQI